MHAGSPWGRTVYYEDHEFEAIMDELRARADGGAFEPGRGVDVDVVLERGLGVAPDYADLPAGILGRTRFGPDGRFQVEVSRALAEEAERDRVARRRLRSTLAHECGHGALHAHLHLADTQTYPLFGDQPTRPSGRVLCRQDAIGSSRGASPSGYDGAWWEYQANRGMAALLLPRRLLAAQVRAACAAGTHSSVEAAVGAGAGEALLHDLAGVFDVNPAMVLYRLQALGYLPRSAAQMGLELEN